MAKTIAFLEENKIKNYEELVKMSQNAAAEFQQLSKQIKLVEEQIYEAKLNCENQNLQMMAVSSSQKFQISTDQNPANILSELQQTKIELLANYKQQKTNMREIQTVLANTKEILSDSCPEKLSKSVSR
jgi:CHAT domain-containing protein